LAVQEKRIPAVFYRTESGKEPVRDWLKRLDVEDRKVIGSDLKAVEYGWPVGMPLCRALGDKLWEVRCNISDRRIARVIFCIWGEQMVLLTGFVKKTRKTPDADLKLALSRRKEIENSGKKSGRK
jgi:phage-related protein